MFILYALPTCPYCQKVRDFLNEQSIPFQELDITEEEHEKALVEKGGKRQVPFLVDEDADVSLYESDAIIEYLRAKHMPHNSEEESES